MTAHLDQRNRDAAKDAWCRANNVIMVRVPTFDVRNGRCTLDADVIREIIARRLERALAAYVRSKDM